MALTVQALQASLPTAVPALELNNDPAQKLASPRDPASALPPGMQSGAVDTTVRSTASEVDAIHKQILSSDSNAASHARRETSSNDTGVMQIGARARIATEGVQNVGGAGGTNAGSK